MRQTMYYVIYQWDVPAANQAAFLAAWEKTTTAIRESTTGARGSLCFVSEETPTEILTIARWDELDQWRDFIEGAPLTSMKDMHALGTRVSAKAYRQAGDFTV